MDSKCIVCEILTRKYKCPKCMEYYCSLTCFKKHKEIGCLTKVQQKDSEENQAESYKITLPFTTEDTVHPEKLKQLEHSENLKKLLYNPHLRNYLKEIYEAPNSWKAMKVAMQEPLFIEFADECLKIVEPPEKPDE